MLLLKRQKYGSAILQSATKKVDFNHGVESAHLSMFCFL